jgi:glycosyltransferase involved in cell wall biosynthesis
VADNTINVAYVGRFVEFKGAELFLALSKSGVLPAKHNLQFLFHQFGELEPRLQEGCTTVEFYGLYDDNEIELILQQQNIHIVTFLSISPESYSYATTRILRAGIPVVYLPRGAVAERLAQAKHAFAVDEPTLASVEAGVSRAVEFVMEHQGTDTILREQSPNIQPTKWYLNNYPEIAE